jgi:hypothetical protein
VGCGDDTVSEVAENLRHAAQRCTQHSAVTLRVRPMEDLPSTA